MTQAFSSSEQEMRAAVAAYDRGSEAVSQTLKEMRTTVDALFASNYKGLQANALSGVFSDLAKQTQQVEVALGPQGLAGLVRTVSDTYTTADSDIAGSINQIGSGAVFNRLAG